MNVKIEKEDGLSDIVFPSLLNISNCSIPFSYNKEQSSEEISLEDASSNILDEISFNEFLIQIKMEKAESQKKSLNQNSSSSTSKDNSLDQQNGIDSHGLGNSLNLNPSISVKIKEMSATKVKATSFNTKQESTIKTAKLPLEQQVKLGCFIISEAQHDNIGLLLPCIDQCESMDSSETNKSSRSKNNTKLNVGSTSFVDTAVLESSQDKTGISPHYNSCKRPRLADTTPVSNAHIIEEALTKPLKRCSREELERIILGHMVGYVSTYKPYVDIERELDSCKVKIENLQQKNNSLTKEVVDLRNIVKSFVTKDAKNFARPMKQLRSVGVQVNPYCTDNVRPEKNDNFQTNLVKCEESKPSRNDSQLPQKAVGKNGSPSSSCFSIHLKKCENLRGENVPQQVMANETIETKEDDDDLMVTFDKLTNFTQSNVSFNRHQPIPLAGPIPAKPIISITKTIDNYTSAIRISWKFPEKSNDAKIASCRVFMLNEKKVSCVKNNNWIPVSGDTSRMSCTIPLGRPDRLRNRYQFKVRATDIHGRVGPYSDVAHVDFP